MADDDREQERELEWERRARAREVEETRRIEANRLEREASEKALGLAQERGREQAETESHFSEHDRHLAAINGSIDRLAATNEKSAKEIAAIHIELATLKTKLAFYAAIGSLAGGGLVAVIVGVATRAGG
jgi:hypothetical protein